MGAGGTGGVACVEPRLAGGTGWYAGSLDETQPDRTTRPISTIAGPRIELLQLDICGVLGQSSHCDALKLLASNDTKLTQFHKLLSPRSIAPAILMQRRRGWCKYDV